MDRFYILLLVFSISFGITFLHPPAISATDGIQWQSYEEGISRGKAENKKVFLSFYADWCQYCKIMEKETFQNSAVIAYINRNFIPIRVNSDKEQKTAAIYNVRGLPSTWFLSEKGERIGNRPGLISASEMIPVLKYIQTDSYKSMSFNAFLKKVNQ